MEIKTTPTFKQFLQAKKSMQREKVILSTIQCKMTEILTQAGNDKTTNLRENNCKEKWYGL